MKKLMSIIALGLLLSGNAYSKSDIDIAIEQCADAQFYGNELGISKAIYEDHVIYKLMLEDEVQIQKDYDEYGVVYQDTYKKYWKDNPRPKPPKQSTLSTYSFEDYKKAKVKWDEEEDKYIKPFTDKLLAFGEKVKKQKILIKEMRRSLVAMSLKKITLKDKAKSIQEYTTKFTLCESDHNKTPRGFMLQWGE
tara:strand:+ start:53 stop:631 length:579 start_codon:yes stop_codon:yes gene_type:complete